MRIVFESIGSNQLDVCTLVIYLQVVTRDCEGRRESFELSGEVVVQE